MLLPFPLQNHGVKAEISCNAASISLLEGILQTGLEVDVEQQGVWAWMDPVAAGVRISPVAHEILGAES